MTAATPRRLGTALEVALLASLTVLPQLLGGRGRLNADTKQYLYLDPGDLMARARVLWDARVGGGTVTHQALGYLWPMGPYYWATDQLGVPAWAAQRLWIGGIQLVATLGALVLFRHLGAPRHARLAGAVLYGLSPFVLGHVTGQSGLLLPFAALGWLVWTMARAVEEGGWRWPAAFALVVTSCASLNGSSVFFVVLAAVLWVPVAVFDARQATVRQGVAAILRAGGLTVATQLWWLTAYAVGGRYGLPILSVTEQVQTTSFTTSAAEVLRGLGYWFFYGADSEGLWLRDLAPPYLERTALLAVSFAVPLAALALGAVTRWGPRTYFAVLVGLGTVIAAGAFPEPTRSPAGAAFEALSRRSELVLSLRNTQRAGAIVALGLAGLVVGGVAALDRHSRRGATTAAVVVGVLVAAAFPAQWRSGLIAERFHREEIPEAWVDAAAHLDEGTGRVLEVPGIDFASYRWGHTLDPVSVGLTERPIAARELVPMGGAAGASLLGAMDRSIQEGWAEPGTLATVARLLGASEVLVRNDLEYERYRTVRPGRFWDLVTDPASGLRLDEVFAPGTPNRANPRRPLLDEIELARDPDEPVPPQVAVFDVPGGGREALSARPRRGAVVVDGDGEGIVHAAAAGLLDGLDGPVLLGADLVRDGGRFDELAPAGTAFVVTDTNRKRGERWYALRENVGATEPAEHAAVTDDPSDARLEVVPGQPDAARSVVEWNGAERVWATAYGSALTLVPEERPSNAFDGDPRTAWLVETFQYRPPHRIGIDLDEPLAADHVVLVPPQRRPGARRVTSARVTLDGNRRIDVAIDEATWASGRVRVPLDGRPFERLTVDILGVAPDPGPAGFAEIEVPGLQVTEVVALPTAVLDALGERTRDVPLALVLARHRADPAEPVRADPEPALRRTFDLPAPVALELRGTARVSPRAPEPVTAPLLATGDVAVASESLPGDLRSHGAAAVDGDRTTAWQTPFVGLVGQWVDVPADPAVAATELTLAVVADRRHSLPTRLTLQGAGEPVTVDLQAFEDEGAAPGAVAEVTVALPRPVQGERIRLTIDQVEQRTTTDWYTGDPIALPVAIAEVSIAGAGLRSRTAASIDTGCRDDLLALDGRPLAVRVVGSIDEALDREGLRLEACEGPLRLGAGRHELRAVPGTDTGLDLDRLVLATPAFAAPDAGPVPSVRVDGTGPASASATIDSDGSPFWLVLDQSNNAGWDLTLDGARVDGPRPLDGHAAAWYVEPDEPGTLRAAVRWAPQRLVDVALALSAAAALGCLALVVAGGRRRRAAVATPPVPALGRPRQVRPAFVVLLAAVAAGVLVHPLAAVPAAGAALVARRWPWAGRALPVALVAVAAAQVVGFQLRDRHEAAFEWPQHFGGAHVAALLGAVLLAVLALGEPAEGDDAA